MSRLLYEARSKVAALALRALKRIDDGAVGVDIKLKQGRLVIIKVNNNPSIDSDVEDGFLGDRLYELIMEDLPRRLQQR